jgi:hypothetical protein
VAPPPVHAQGFRTGVLPLRWDSGGPDCSVVQKDFQIWKYDDDFYILRQSGCVHSEKPCEWLKRNNRTSIPLVVTHLHSHSDHTWGDPSSRTGPTSRRPLDQRWFNVVTLPTREPEEASKS